MNKIPPGTIEVAEKYMILSNTVGAKPIKIGGRIMMDRVVLQQMDRDKIVATSGVEKKFCMIIVDYSIEEVLDFVRMARAGSQKLLN